MRHALALLPLIALAACATPRESCINDVTRYLRSVDHQIAETERALASGYRTETREIFGFVDERCETVNEEGETIRYDCTRPGWTEEDVRVRINRPAEEARLAALRAQRDSLEQQARPAVAACVAAHPE